MSLGFDELFTWGVFAIFIVAMVIAKGFRIIAWIEKLKKLRQPRTGEELSPARHWRWYLLQSFPFVVILMDKLSAEKHLPFLLIAAAYLAGFLVISWPLFKIVLKTLGFLAGKPVTRTPVSDFQGHVAGFFIRLAMFLFLAMFFIERLGPITPTGSWTAPMQIIGRGYGMTAVHYVPPVLASLFSKALWGSIGAYLFFKWYFRRETEDEEE